MLPSQRLWDTGDSAFALITPFADPLGRTNKRGLTLMVLGGQERIVSGESPFSRLCVRGDEALTGGIAGNWNRNSDSDDSLHTTRTQIPAALAGRVKEHDVERKANTDGRISGRRQLMLPQTQSLARRRAL